MNKSFSIILFLSLLLASCKERPQRLPTSSAKPYEVLVVGDVHDSLKNLLSKDSYGLPQPEPMFDVSSISHKQFHGSMQLARAIVVYDNNTDTVIIKKNKYAEPQLIVYGSPKDSNNITFLLNQFEQRNRVIQLKKKHNIRIEAYIKKQFGIDILIPSDMTSSKKEKNFLWISNNAPTGMTNICIYMEPESTHQFIRNCGNTECFDITMMRNKWLGKYIKGETDNMYMSTVENSVHPIPSLSKNYKDSEITKRKDIQYISSYYGLWEMKNDAMGGPFIMKGVQTRKDQKDYKVIVDCFVYAPEMKKRNLMRQLEAVLYTIKSYNYYGRK